MLFTKNSWQFSGYVQAQLQTLYGTFTACIGIGESATCDYWSGEIGLKLHEFFNLFVVQRRILSKQKFL